MARKQKEAVEDPGGSPDPVCAIAGIPVLKYQKRKPGGTC